MIELFNCDCVQGMSEIADSSVQCVMTDPPYLYLKNQKLDRPFDEKEFFSQCKRVLKDEGFVVLFGRGESFYRWNTILAGLGFVFKEEIIWDKTQTSSPLLSISRVHETIAIWAKKNGILNTVKVPYLEMKRHDLDAIITDMKRLKVMLNNTKSLNEGINFLENNEFNFSAVNRPKSTTVSSENLKNSDRSVYVLKAVKNGMNEKSIIKVTRDHYTAIHPTQKPVALIKRLLNLTAKNGDTILDGFLGSGSTAIASVELGMNFIGYEIDAEFFDAAEKRIANTNTLIFGD